MCELTSTGLPWCCVISDDDKTEDEGEREGRFWRLKIWFAGIPADITKFWRLPEILRELAGYKILYINYRLKKCTEQLVHIMIL